MASFSHPGAFVEPMMILPVVKVSGDAQVAEQGITGSLTPREQRIRVCPRGTARLITQMSGLVAAVKAKRNRATTLQSGYRCSGHQWQQSFALPECSAK